MKKDANQTVLQVSKVAGDLMTTAPTNRCYKCKQKFDDEADRHLKFGCLAVNPENNNKIHVSWLALCVSCTLEVAKALDAKSVSGVFSDFEIQIEQE